MGNLEEGEERELERLKSRKPPTPRDKKEQRR